jgi:hypothetical protein
MLLVSLLLLFPLRLPLLLPPLLLFLAPQVDVGGVFKTWGGFSMQA